jgi:hypothetical protein
MLLSSDVINDSHPQKKLATKTDAFCIANPIEANDFRDWINELASFNPVIIDDIFALLVTHRKWKWQIQSSIKALSHTSARLITHENIKLLLIHSPYAQFLATLLDYLYRIDPILINDDNRSLLAAHAKEAFLLVGLLAKLNVAGPHLINENNFRLLVENLFWACELGNAFDLLNDSNLLSQPIFDELLDLCKKQIKFNMCIGKDVSLLDLYSKLTILIQKQLNREKQNQSGVSRVIQMFTFFTSPFSGRNNKAAQKVLQYIFHKTVEFTEADISALERQPLRALMKEYNSIIEINNLPRSHRPKLTR